MECGRALRGRWALFFEGVLVGSTGGEAGCRHSLRSGPCGLVSGGEGMEFA